MDIQCFLAVKLLWFKSLTSSASVWTAKSLQLCGILNKRTMTTRHFRWSLFFKLGSSTRGPRAWWSSSVSQLFVFSEFEGLYLPLLLLFSLQCPDGGPSPVCETLNNFEAGSHLDLRANTLYRWKPLCCGFPCMFCIAGLFQGPFRRAWPGMLHLLLQIPIGKGSWYHFFFFN